LANVHTAAQERGARFTPPSAGGTVQLVVAAQPKEEKKDDKTKPPQIDLAAAAPETFEAERAPSPHMMGDQGLYSLILVPVPALAKLQVGRGETIDVPFTATRKVRVPVPGRGGIKIGENENVMPGNRAYFSYNYYNNVQAPADGADQFQTSSQTVVVNGRTFQADIFVPGVRPLRGDIHRQTFGLEKSFLDDRFSLGVRVPLYQQTGDPGFEDADLGDMSFIVKWAPYQEYESGSGISVGLAVTAPTGPDIQTPSGELHTTIVQPFMGYQINRDRLLVFGFTSIAVPTDERDLTVWFNDIGVGYRLFEGGLFRSVVPAIEAHVTTPLDHRSPTDEIRGLDLVVLTGGVHLGVGQRSMLTLGVATPITGPRPYDVEALVQFNLRF
jgi:hypothetical protein